MPVRAVLEVAAGLAEGLRAIHAAGVVHRDLKPSNVLLAPDGPRVIDFGISRATEASALTHTGMVVGTPGFMSPEQALGGEVGPSTDIFSLGAVLAYAATGEGPFGAGSTPALVYRVVHSPASLDHVPAEIRPLIDRCLAKDPSQRPTARELLAETSAVEPVTGWLPAPMTQTFLQLPRLFSGPVASVAPRYAPVPYGTTPARSGTTLVGVSATPARSGTTLVGVGATPARSSTTAVGSSTTPVGVGATPAASTGSAASPTGSGASRAVTAAATVPAPPGPAFGQRRRESRRPRRGLRRPLAIAAIAAGLVAASTAGSMALAASLTQSPGMHAGQQATSGQSNSPTTYQPPTAYQNTSQPVVATSSTAPAASASTPPSPVPSASAPAAPAPAPSPSYYQGTGGY